MIEKILNEYYKALEQYSECNVDVMSDEKGIYITYHSRHNSFPITDYICTVNDVNVRELMQVLDDKSIGYCI